MARHIYLSILLAISVTTGLAQKDTTWLRRWAGSGTTYQEDWARDIAVDDLGNVYVTGICNAGGVVVSYFEWVQGIQSYFWDLDEVNRRLQMIMTKSFNEVYDGSVKDKVTMRDAAFMIAIGKIAKAIEMRGIFP